MLSKSSFQYSWSDKQKVESVSYLNERDLCRFANKSFCNEESKQYCNGRNEVLPFEEANGMNRGIDLYFKVEFFITNVKEFWYELKLNVSSKNERGSQSPF